VRTRFETLLKRAARPTEPDAELLRRFAAGRDEAAFAELVRRYGPLVWGQCRHLLFTEADADDAFQATFLVLAKSAGTVRDTDRLGPWLHGVAYRVCRNARRSAARRAKRDRKTATSEATRPVADSAWDSALAAVHAELHDLPETLRVPFVLCCLEGKSVTEAAGQLGLKLGTFSSRLTRAKQALMDRLSARGLTAAVLAMATVATGAANAPAKTAAKAVGFATLSAAVPSNILSLTHGVMGMSTGAFKLLAAGLMVACGLAVGVGGGLTANAQGPGKEKVAKDSHAATEDQLHNLKLKEKLLSQNLGTEHPQIRELEEQIRFIQKEQERAQGTKGDKEKEVDVLRKMLEAQKNQAEAQMQAAEAQLRVAEARLQAERQKGDQGGPAKASAEFKYFGQAPDFAPTPQELETLVKRGEEGGYRYVGLVTMKGTAKQGGGAVPTLVFRKAKMVELHAADLIEQPLKHAAELLDHHKLLDKAKMELGDKMKLLDKGKEQLGDKLKMLDTDKAGLVEKLKHLHEKQAAEADGKAKEKVKEQAAEKKAAEAEGKAKEQATEKVKEKVAEAMKQATEAASKEKAKVDEEVKRALKSKLDADVSKKAGDDVAAEIVRLKAQIAEMEAKAKVPAKASAKFTPAELGKGDFAEQAKMLEDLVKFKFGNDGAKKVAITFDPRDKTIVASGDAAVVQWLQQAVKGLGQPTGGKPK
jgi:RNA polymerase sigma factor (sigma-70 family)